MYFNTNSKFKSSYMSVLQIAILVNKIIKQENVLAQNTQPTYIKCINCLLLSNEKKMFKFHDVFLVLQYQYS